jgi:biotin synthase-like enzyme
MHRSPARNDAEAAPRHDWTCREIREVHESAFPDLLYRAQTTHRQYHDAREVQLCTLLSIKTGHVPKTVPTVRRARTTGRGSPRSACSM